MKTRLILATVAALLLTLLAQAPSQAATTTNWPVVGTWKLYPNAGRIAIQIEGGSYVWGIRKFAAEADQQVHGVRVYTRGTCAQRPWATCVHVRTVFRPYSGWYGVARWTGKYDRVILLNDGTRKHRKYAVAAHEFTHILGLTHHRQYGVVGRTRDVIHLSWVERRALNQAY